MDLFTQLSETHNGLRIIAINVQSPPKKRALSLAGEITELNPDIIVLSELSSAEGSQELLGNLYHYARYDIFWQKPDKNNYAVAICIKGLNASIIPISEQSNLSRIQIVRVNIASRELNLVGIYAPALNEGNILRRVDFFNTLRKVLSRLKKINSGGIVLVGDVNAVSAFHTPRIYAFDQEGYPLDAIIRDLDFIDLFQTRMPKQEYTWFSPDNSASQLLDNCYVSSDIANQIKKCEILHHFRTEKLSDHSAILIEGFE